jgi:hypothetical protein
LARNSTLKAESACTFSTPLSSQSNGLNVDIYPLLLNLSLLPMEMLVLLPVLSTSLFHSFICPLFVASSTSFFCQGQGYKMTFTLSIMMNHFSMCIRKKGPCLKWLWASICACSSTILLYITIGHYRSLYVN